MREKTEEENKSMHTRANFNFCFVLTSYSYHNTWFFKYIIDSSSTKTPFNSLQSCLRDWNLEKKKKAKMQNYPSNQWTWRLPLVDVFTSSYAYQLRVDKEQGFLGQRRGLRPGIPFPLRRRSDRRSVIFFLFCFFILPVIVAQAAPQHLAAMRTKRSRTSYY